MTLRRRKILSWQIRIVSGIKISNLVDALAHKLFTAPMLNNEMAATDNHIMRIAEHVCQISQLYYWIENGRGGYEARRPGHPKKHCSGDWTVSRLPGSSFAFTSRNHRLPLRTFDMLSNEVSLSSRSLKSSCGLFLNLFWEILWFACSKALSTKA